MINNCQKNTVKSGIKLEILCKKRLIASRCWYESPKMNTHFHVKEIPKEGSLLFIVIYLICKISKTYYPQLFSEETKDGQIHH